MRFSPTYTSGLSIKSPKLTAQLFQNNTIHTKNSLPQGGVSCCPLWTHTGSGKWNWSEQVLPRQVYLTLTGRVHTHFLKPTAKPRQAAPSKKRHRLPNPNYQVVHHRFHCSTSPDEWVFIKIGGVFSTHSHQVKFKSVGLSWPTGSTVFRLFLRPLDPLSRAAPGATRCPCPIPPTEHRGR